MSSTPSSAISAQEYAKVKEEVTFAYTTYASVLYPALSKANNHADCLIHAALLGDSTARLQNFVNNLLSDPTFFDIIFKVRGCLEALAANAQTRGEAFTMPACHSAVRALTKRIHEVRAATQPAASVASAINTAGNSNAVVSVPSAMKTKTTRRSNRKGKAPKSVPMIVDTSSEDEEEVQIIGGDIAMGDSTPPVNNTTSTDSVMSVDSVVPGTTLSVEPMAASTPSIPAPLPANIKFNKNKDKEPIVESNDASKAQAVHYAKKGFEETRKRQRSGVGSEYINIAPGTSLAFPNSSAQVAAAASSSSSPAATEIIHKAKDLVHNISLSPKSERGLIKQESDLRSELDVTINRVHYLLQYFDLLKAQHVQVLKELHVAEGTSVE
ncbi:hypothetical protein C8R41DRAFT_904845 [Lentinula lateritia]|uniref:Uncharacterized protein n=1 Tax=Lentinula lateritia TaxID=40482 RepID=A0ABQ8V874_9AGAR|nr:hypothetical protein C8R41DRAFT_984279 [Lentinula lateritia]KAJ4476247.1 hypothetical protein C8R41DRAFT_904845 [Lentinula lateritia]